MARHYAGTLGVLAFATLVARGLVRGADAETILLAAWVGLLVFSVIGGLIGWLAGRTVEESVEALLKRSLAPKPQPSPSTDDGEA